jgi:hypothetical protein
MTDGSIELTPRRRRGGVRRARRVWERRPRHQLELVGRRDDVDACSESEHCRFREYLGEDTKEYDDREVAAPLARGRRASTAPSPAS